MRLLLQLLYYPAALLLAASLVLGAQSMADLHRAVAARQSPEMSTERELKLLAETLTFGLYAGGSEANAELGDLLAAAEREARRAELSAWWLAGLSAAFLLPAAFGLRRRDRPAVLVFSRDLLGVSGVLLVVGILAPVLSVAVHKDLPVLGEVVLQHDTKSIVGTVLQLVSLGSWFTAVLLALFSIVTPFVKLLLSWIAANARNPRRVLAAIEHVGKWSMTDVFVVAVLLAFLAAGPGGMTRATLGVGLYFFAGYAIASQVAGHLLVHALRDRARTEEPT